jgi:hypothetical protein
MAPMMALRSAPYLPASLDNRCNSVGLTDLPLPGQSADANAGARLARCVHVRFHARCSVMTPGRRGERTIAACDNKDR